MRFGEPHTRGATGDFVPPRYPVAFAVKRVSSNEKWRRGHCRDNASPVTLCVQLQDHVVIIIIIIIIIIITIIIIIQFICIAPESIVLLSGALHECTNSS